MIECFAATHAWFWIITALLIISEALGETKLVKANGVLSLILVIFEKTLRFIRKAIFRR